MIKGVNKQIIEINNPDSIYFDKVVFYLRPEVHAIPEEISRREIQRCFASSGIRSGKRRLSRRGAWLITTGAALMGAAVLLSLFR